MIRRKKYRNAFSIMEILVGLVIVCILAALLIMVTRQSIEKTNSIVCLSNLRQMGSAAIQYAMEHNGDLPPPYMPTSASDSMIFYRLLNKYLSPYDENAELSKYPKIYRCPSDQAPFLSGIASYGCNQYLGTSGARNSSGNIYNLGGGNPAYPRNAIILYIDATSAAINPAWGLGYMRVAFRHDHRCNAVMMDGSATSSFAEDENLLASPINKHWGAN